MSILIKGIDAPKYGFIEIRLYDNRVEAEFQEHEYTDLEIEEVPETHGRLIDADKMITRFENINDFLMGDCKFCELASSDKARVDELANCIAEIVNAPTVIKAEKQRNE